MKHDSEFPKAIAKVRDNTNSPFDLGVNIGSLLCNIKRLVATNLENEANCHLPIPGALHWAPDFVHAVADYMLHLRTKDNLPDALIDIPLYVYDRKARYKQRKCKEKYARLVQIEYKKRVREVLGGLFARWNPIKTQAFNQGIDKALTRTMWKVYPLGNVVLEAGDGDWADWLFERCGELEKAAIKARIAVDENGVES